MELHTNMFIDNFVSFLAHEYARKRGEVSFASLNALNDAQLRTAIQKNCFYEELIAELPKYYEKFLDQIRENDRRGSFVNDNLTTISKLNERK